MEFTTMFLLSTLYAAEVIDGGKGTTLPHFIENLKKMYYTSRRQPAMLSCDVTGIKFLAFSCNGNRFHEDQLKVKQDYDYDHSTDTKSVRVSVEIQPGVVSTFLEERGDNAKFTCMCVVWYLTPDYSWAKKESNIATIKSAFMEQKFMVEPVDVAVRVGGTAVFECTPPRGEPNPTISWTKDNQNIDTSNRKFKMVGDGSLTILKVKRRDEGAYVCVASNHVRTVNSLVARLTIADAVQVVDSIKGTTLPHFIENLKKMYYTSRRQPAMLSCDVTGTKILTFICNGNQFHEDQLKVKQDYDRSTNTESMKLSVEIQHGAVSTFLEERRDNAKFTCMCVAWYLTPDYSWAKKESNIATIKLAFMEQKFMVEPVDVAVRVGGTAVFECTPPRGEPNPTISWTKDNQNIDTSNRRFKMVGDGSLTILKVKRRDDGAYVCVASNCARTVNSLVARLTIADAAQVVDSSKGTTLPHFTENLKKMYYTSRRQPAMLSCDVTGTKILTFICNGNRFHEDQLKVKQDYDNSTNTESMKLSVEIQHGTVSTFLEERRDNAKFTCICVAWYLTQNHSWTKRESNIAAIKLAFMEQKFMVEPADVAARVGGMAVFECTPPRGEPNPTISWTKDNQNIDTSNRRFKMVGDGSLTILKVKRRDEGAYVCVASNRARTVNSLVARLTIAGDSTTSIPEPVHVTEPEAEPEPEPESETTPEMIKANYTESVGEISVKSEVTPSAEYTTEIMPENTTMYLDQGDSTTSIPEPVHVTEAEPEPETETTPEMIKANYTESVGEINVTSEVTPSAEYTTEIMPENTTMYLDKGDSTKSTPYPETEPEAEPESETQTTPEMIEGNYTEFVGENNITSKVMPSMEYTTASMPEKTTMYFDQGTDAMIHTMKVTPEPEPECGTGKALKDLIEVEESKVTFEARRNAYQKAQIAFHPTTCTVNENHASVSILVNRTGNTNIQVRLGIEMLDGTTSRNETVKYVDVAIKDDDLFEQDKTYRVTLFLYPEQSQKSDASNEEKCPEEYGFKEDKVSKLCYKIVSDVSKSFEAAKNSCKSYSARGRLIVLNTASKMDHVKSQLKDYSAQSTVSVAEQEHFWIGAERSEDKTFQVWSDGTLIDARFWARGEPSNNDRTENCAAMDPHHDYQLNDDNCVIKRGFICEVPIL